MIKPAQNKTFCVLCITVVYAAKSWLAPPNLTPRFLKRFYSPANSYCKHDNKRTVQVIGIAPSM